MGYLKVGVKMFKSHLTQSQSVNVHDEVQTIKIDSTPTSEIQVSAFTMVYTEGVGCTECSIVVSCKSKSVLFPGYQKNCSGGIAMK